MKKVLCVVLALVLCICTFTSCGKKETSGRNFAVACESIPKTFDPQIAATVTEKTVALNCFDTLMRPDENGTLCCLAAESYTVSKDSLVYTFKIRDGLRYFVSKKAEAFIADKGGEKPTFVTAYDFAFGITRAVLPETEAADYLLLSSIKNAEKVHSGECPKSELGVKAVDAKTLVITLEKKDPNFLFALSQAVSAPCNEKFFELTAGRYGLEQKYTVSNGAFYVSNTASETAISISKNAEYKGINEAVPNAVTFYLNTDEGSVASKIKKGNYDCGFVGTSHLKALGNKNTKQSLTNITYSLLFNFTQERFNSLKLRMGLVSSVDFSEIQNRAGGIAAPDYMLCGNKISNNGVNKVQCNVERARANLKEAMSELGTSSISINILCTAETENTAKLIVSSWQTNVGVELNGSVTVCEQADFDSAVAKGEFDVVIYPVSTPSSDVNVLLSSLLNGENNISGYESEEYERILKELKDTQSPEKLIYAQNFLIENYVVIPLYFDSRYLVLSEGVSGIYYVNDGANVYFYKGRKV